MTASSTKEGSLSYFSGQLPQTADGRALATTQHDMTQHNIYNTNIVVLC